MVNPIFRITYGNGNGFKIRRFGKSRVNLSQYFCHTLGVSVHHDFYNAIEIHTTHIKQHCTCVARLRPMQFTARSMPNSKLMLWEKRQLIAGSSYEKTCFGCLHLIHMFSSKLPKHAEEFRIHDKLNNSNLLRPDKSLPRYKFTLRIKISTTTSLNFETPQQHKYTQVR